MRNEDGIWCDMPKCKKSAIHVLSCRVEQSEFALCDDHNKWWISRSRGIQEYQIRCPRCLPAYLDSHKNQIRMPGTTLPSPITGPLADAIEEAMYRQGVLQPDRIMVLRRLAATESSYVRAIFRSTAGTAAGYEDEKAI